MTTEFLSAKEIDGLLDHKPTYLEGAYPHLNKGAYLFIEDENKRKLKCKILLVAPHTLAHAGVNKEFKAYKLARV